MHPVLLLIVYALLCAVASLAGGWLPFVVRLTHRGMQIAISFVSGIVLGIGLLHLLPHAAHALGSLDRTVLWMLGGFLCMFFLERFFHFHHHDAPERAEPGAACDALDHTLHPHAHHEHAEHAHHPKAAHTTSACPWVGVAVGLTLHALIDGVTIAAAVAAESLDGALLAGVGAFLAVALHKPFDSLTIGTLMVAANRPPGLRHALNVGYALVTPLGIAVFYALASGTSDPTHGLGQTLAFAAGSFLCIATSDLLPELQFHRHDRLTLSAALIAGLALAWATVFLEGTGHDHLHAPTGAPHAEEHDHDEHRHEDPHPIEHRHE
jgi:zinc and cadmium transporter